MISVNEMLPLQRALTTRTRNCGVSTTINIIIIIIIIAAAVVALPLPRNQTLLAA